MFINSFLKNNCLLFNFNKSKIEIFGPFKLSIKICEKSDNNEIKF